MDIHITGSEGAGRSDAPGLPAEGRALRTETTINDTTDFRIGKRLTNLPAPLREIGLLANRRLLGVQRLSHDPARGAEVFAAVNDPILGPDGQRTAGLRFAEARSHALLSALLVFRLLPHGFTNRELRVLTAELLGKDPDQVSACQMTYDLRRLRAHGLITRLSGSHRYQVTDNGLRHALFLTRARADQRRRTTGRRSWPRWLAGWSLVLSCCRVT